MKNATTMFAAIKRSAQIRYHRLMAKWYLKAANAHQANVILMLNRVPRASLAKLRGYAAAHDQKAKQARIGEFQ